MIRLLFIVAILPIFSLCLPVEAAKHIIIIYDVSSSMYRLNRPTSGNIRMEPEDIRRVNDYLTNLLFINTSQFLRDRNDTHIKKCDAAYVGKPLYQRGDIITYAEYAKRRYTKINREQVRREEFQRKLPDPMNLRESFYGTVSYLLRAEVEVYDELYREVDGETYWIFVTDGDVDQSGGSDPNIGEILQQHAAIEEKYEDPMIVGILVNNHVKIEVRQIQEQTLDAVFIANRTAPKEPVTEIQLSKVDAEQFISEFLIIDTKFDDKIKYKLNSVNIEIVDKFNNPLQIVKDDNEFSVLKAPSVPLHGNMPPYEFQILLPANPEIFASSNKLKLGVNYNYNGREKTYSTPLTRTVIKDIFVSDLDNPIQQTEKVELHFMNGAYFATLVVRSENPDKIPFRIKNIHCHILKKDDQKLCDASVKTIPQKLDEPFQIMVTNEKNLDLSGNKFVLNIDYNYNDTAKSKTIKLPLESYGSNRGFVMMILIILGIVGLVVVGFVLVNASKKNNTEYQIMLAEVDYEGISSNDVHSFKLVDGETLSFGSGNINDLNFDVDSTAFLRCRKGEFWLYESANDEEGRKLNSGETLTLRKDEGNEVQVSFDIGSDAPQQIPVSDFVPEEDDDLLPD